MRHMNLEDKKMAVAGIFLLFLFSIALFSLSNNAQTTGFAIFESKVEIIGTATPTTGGGGGGSGGGGPALNARRTCGSDSQCLTGEICLNFKCEKGCRNTTDCPLANICQNNQCVSGCDSDDRCPTETICVNGSCIVGCNVDSDCAGARICYQGLCESGIPKCSVNTDCADDQVCTNGECIKISCDGYIENRQCISGCRTDTDCSSSEICESSTCISGCRNDASCAADEFCSSQNTCVIKENVQMNLLDEPIEGEEVRVEVRDAEGNLLRNTPINITYPNGEVVTLTTDGSGIFRVLSEQLGNVRMQVAASDYQPKTFSYEVLPRERFEESFKGKCQAFFQELDSQASLLLTFIFFLLAAYLIIYILMSNTELFWGVSTVIGLGVFVAPLALVAFNLVDTCSMIYIGFAVFLLSVLGVGAGIMHKKSLGKKKKRKSKRK